MNLHSISQLYANVLNRDIAKKRIPEREIRKGVQSMGHVYAPDQTNFESTLLQLPNYNDPACRVAYLHKYAPLHTYIVLDAMLKILQARPDLFRDLLINSSEFKFCSLGGGPGSDVIGVLTALRAVFGAFNASITVIDYMKKWEETFSSVICELTVGSYGKVWNSIPNDCRLNFHYVGFNLLSTMTNEVNKTIGSALLLTMVKFVSAAICTDTEEMVDKIFRVMKPGALVLYIDNAAGGFTQIVERSSQRNGLVAVYGPNRHVAYEAEDLKIERFGYQSCYKTKVTLILLQKMMNHQFIQRNISQDTNFSNPSVFVPKTQQEPVNFNVLKNSASKRAHMGSSIIVPEPAKTVSSDGKAAKALSNVVVDQNNFGAKKNNNVPTVVPNKVGAKSISGSSFKQNKTGTKNISSLLHVPEHSASVRLPPFTVNNLGHHTQVPSLAYEPRLTVPNTVRCVQPTSSTTADNHWPETNDNAGDTCCACCVISFCKFNLG